MQLTMNLDDDGDEDDHGNTHDEVPAEASAWRESRQLCLVLEVRDDSYAFGSDVLGDGEVGESKENAD